ncbi:molybdopterin converting factor subunit 1 [Reinekea marina]|uniref:Molybdopterin synthase sulfur carrier subunit n=2 Tax=Reinekea marina TaxID=1310421 RepID=A0ABV7WSX9_9GAMM
MNYFTLKFFAKLREEVGVSELDIPCSEVTTLSSLTDYLVSKHPQWASFLDGQLLKAVNHQMVSGDVTIKAGDEVALFPPVTGG